VLELTTLRHDRRGFVHKRIGGAIGGFLTGGVTGAIGGAIRGGGGGGGQTTQTGVTPAQARALDAGGDWATVARSLGVNVSQAQRITRQRERFGVTDLFAPRGDCGFGRSRSVITGNCVIDLDPGQGTGLPGGADAPGVAVMGRYGAAMIPHIEARQHSECLPGMVLGTDGLCYNKRDITNRERRYPKGRAPLLTGGERNAITKAARAAGKIKRTTKQLQKMGMLPKPSSRRRAPAPRARQIGPAGPSIINVE